MESEEHVKQRVSQWLEVQKKHGVNQKEIAKAWHVSEQYISQLKNKKSSIGLEIIKNIIEFDIKINIRWLLFGEGEMYHSKYNSNKNTNILHEPMTEYNSKIDDLIKSNEKLIETNQILIKKIDNIITKST